MAASSEITSEKAELHTDIAATALPPEMTRRTALNASPLRACPPTLIRFGMPQSSTSLRSPALSPLKVKWSMRSFRAKCVSRYSIASSELPDEARAMPNIPPRNTRTLARSSAASPARVRAIPVTARFLSLSIIMTPERIMLMRMGMRPKENPRR